MKSRDQQVPRKLHLKPRSKAGHAQTVERQKQRLASARASAEGTLAGTKRTPSWTAEDAPSCAAAMMWPQSTPLGRPSVSVAKSSSDMSFMLPETTGFLSDHYVMRDETLAWGANAIVRTCKHRRTGVVYACKSVSKSVLQPGSKIYSGLRTEISVLSTMLGTANVAELAGVFEDGFYVHVVMEYCQGGSLEQMLEQVKSFGEVEALWLFRKIMLGVQACHEKGILHRDLRPGSVLLCTSQGVEPKLIDFHSAVKLQPGESAKGLFGRPEFMAPEVICGALYNSAADIWSLGVMLFYMLAGWLPFSGDSVRETFSYVFVGFIDFSRAPWPSISDPVKLLVRQMLAQDPLHRPSCQHILKHPRLLACGPCPVPIPLRPYASPDAATARSAVLSTPPASMMRRTSAPSSSALLQAALASSKVAKRMFANGANPGPFAQPAFDPLPYSFPSDSPTAHASNGVSSYTTNSDALNSSSGGQYQPPIYPPYVSQVPSPMMFTSSSVENRAALRRLYSSPPIPDMQHSEVDESTRPLLRKMWSEPLPAALLESLKTRPSPSPASSSETASQAPVSPTELTAEGRLAFDGLHHHQGGAQMQLQNAEQLWYESQQQQQLMQLQQMMQQQPKAQSEAQDWSRIDQQMLQQSSANQGGEEGNSPVCSYSFLLEEGAVPDWPSPPVDSRPQFDTQLSKSSLGQGDMTVKGDDLLSSYAVPSSTITSGKALSEADPYSCSETLPLLFPSSRSPSEMERLLVPQNSNSTSSVLSSCPGLSPQASILLRSQELSPRKPVRDSQPSAGLEVPTVDPLLQGPALTAAASFCKPSRANLTLPVKQQQMEVWTPPTSLGEWSPQGALENVWGTSASLSGSAWSGYGSSDHPRDMPGLVEPSWMGTSGTASPSSKASLSQGNGERGGVSVGGAVGQPQPEVLTSEMLPSRQDTMSFLAELNVVDPWTTAQYQYA
eukprot:TRINITY_DN1325_c0_g1_i1.p1 TRINITY_DN1325_c0_g1~~TRINITY_DN1325_c0_g1_i1.p1  ORF type:complete len:954 (-),score=134.08 TRINITY_DN1325_c0_g1_i1:1695-4556(-)